MSAGWSSPQDPSPVFRGTRVDTLPDDPAATLRLAVVMGMVALGSFAGIPAPELMALANITPGQLGDADATVPALVAAKVLARVAEAMPDRAVSLQLAAVTPPSVFGLVELAGQSASTIEESIDIYLRFGRLTSSHFEAWLERSEGLTAYRCRHLATLESLRIPVEVAICLAHAALVRGGARAPDFVEVHFGHAPCGPVEPYAEYFGCPVFFESFGHALVMRSTLLERPLQHADPVISRSLLARLTCELAQGEDPLSRFRREVAAQALPAHYNAATIARRMGRSLRSLQREASQRGTTLSQIIDDLRIARARELLLDDTLSVDEVGFLVDYSERAAFSRAFKRATGETPVDWRRRGTAVA